MAMQEQRQSQEQESAARQLPNHHDESQVPKRAKSGLLLLWSALTILAIAVIIIIVLAVR